MTDLAPVREPRPRARLSSLPRVRLDVFAILGLPLVIGLLLLIVYPLATALGRSFVGRDGIDLAPLQALLRDPGFSRSFMNTLIVIAVAGSSALLIGSLFAWLNERTDASFGAVSRMAPLVPLLIPPVAMSVGWIFLAQSTAGFLNGFLRAVLGLAGIHLTTGPLDISSWPGLLFAYTIALVPYAYIVVSPALRNMDTALEEASRMSGAGPLRTAIQVSLPAVGPALVSAALLIVIIAAALYSIPAIIGSSARIETLSVYIVYLTQSSSSGLNQSVAASMMLLVFLTGVWGLQRWITQRQRQVKISGKSASGTVVRLGRWRRLAQALIVAYLLSVSVLPFLALVVVALQPFWQANINPGAFTLKAFNTFISGPNKLGRDALMTSLELGAVGASIVMIVATIMVTYAHQVRGTIASFIHGVTKIPAAISGLVIAVAILYTFAGPPFRFKGTPLILLLAYLVMFMPQASIAAETARGQVGDDLLESSSMSGASRLRTSWRVLWPLMRPGLAYGWAMIFVLILGDLIAASILSGPGNMVVGSAIVEIYTGGIFSDLAVLGTVVCVTALVVVGLVITVYGRRAGQRGVRVTEASSAPTLTS